jgi:hypothetical protein
VKIEWYVAIDAASFEAFPVKSSFFGFNRSWRFPRSSNSFLVTTERGHYSKVLHNIIGVTMPDVQSVQYHSLVR